MSNGMTPPYARRTALALACVLCVFVMAGNAAYSDGDFEALWFGTPMCDTPQRLGISLTRPDSVSPRETASYLVELDAAIPYQATRVAFIIKDSTDEIVYKTILDANLRRGRNQLTFPWHASALTAGAYVMAVEVDYANDFPPAYCLLPFQKVSANHWENTLAGATRALDVLENRFAELPPEQANAHYLNSQFNIAQNTLRNARRALAGQEWQRLEQLTNYLETLEERLHAALVFGGGVLEAPAYPKPESYQHISIRDGGLQVDERPVYLFGIALDADKTLDSQMQQMADYGLNFTVATIPVGHSPETIAATIDRTLDDAKASNIAVALELNQDAIAGPIMDEWPELLHTGFVNMAHTEFNTLYTERLAAMASAISGRGNVVAASMAHAPQFKYDGESVRQRFIEQVMERYPDRIDLNRLWRAHLADYDEITIWGEHEDHRYQNRRAYQFEWQSFHRELIAHTLANMQQEMIAHAPDVPVTLTMPNTAFDPGETRYSANRDSTARMMALQACVGKTVPTDSLYAINYPETHAHYALMRSYAPAKPILNLSGDIDLEGVDTPARRYAVTRSAVWEAVISGANGIALPANSTVLDHPESLEAFVFAALDINRLAPIVTAFQQAPPEIGILFSEASKIMDDGVPHLESARYAFEGASFAGHPIHFLTESKIQGGALSRIRVLILPETLAVSDETFSLLAQFVEDGGMVARVGTPIPYNERGHSRGDVIRSTSNTVLVRGMNLPTEYLHAMDAAMERGVLPDIMRPINAFGYPIEGVRSRYVEYDGEHYLYIVNLRTSPVLCHVTGASSTGRDLIQGRDIAFPRVLSPLDPMLIRIDRHEHTATLAMH